MEDNFESTANQLTRTLCLCQLRALRQRYGFFLPETYAQLPVGDLVALVDYVHSRLRGGDVGFKVKYPL